MDAKMKMLERDLLESWLSYWCGNCANRTSAKLRPCERPSFRKREYGTVYCTRYRSEASAL